MKLTTVIEMGDKLKEPGMPVNTTMLSIYLGVGLITLLLLNIRYNRKKGYKDENTSLKGMLAMFGFLLTVPLIGYIQYDAYAERKEAIIEWQEKYVRPYLEQQPFIEKPLVSIEEDNYNQYKNAKQYLVKYRDNDQIVRTLKDPHIVKYTLPASEEPVVRFYQLTENLGHGMAPGEYGINVLLNENGVTNNKPQ